MTYTFLKGRLKKKNPWKPLKNTKRNVAFCFTYLILDLLIRGHVTRCLIANDDISLLVMQVLGVLIKPNHAKLHFLILCISN